MADKIEGIHYQTGTHVSLGIAGGKISNIEINMNQTEEALPYIAPGLVDLQINGYKGFDFNTLPITQELVMKVTEALWEEGVTTYYPTVITNSDQAIEEAVTEISKACQTYQHVNESIAGIHVEGPFISPEDGPRGAHAKCFVKAPDWELFKRWQEAADGRIKIITISPEWPNSTLFIKNCIKTGVIVAIGHTAATSEEIREAVEAGARMSTHLGNGAHLVLPRHPNYLWEQLAQNQLSACLIADGFHLPEAFLKVAMKVKGSQAMLVSDAVYLSGLKPGEYETHIGGRVVLTPEGKLHTADNPSILAGSAQMLKYGIGHVVKAGLTSLEQAWDMASVRPAAFMGLPNKDGLEIGSPADLVLFDWKDQVNILATYKMGKLVFKNDFL